LELFQLVQPDRGASGLLGAEGIARNPCLHHFSRIPPKRISKHRYIARAMELGRGRKFRPEDLSVAISDPGGGGSDRTALDTRCCRGRFFPTPSGGTSPDTPDTEQTRQTDAREHRHRLGGWFRAAEMNEHSG